MSHAEEKSIRWAILGTGDVARKFALDLAHVPGAHLHAVASRNPENAVRFAQELGVDRAADRYGDAVQNVDAVYIATPPALHEEHARVAIDAGAAVLIEKPIALDGAAAIRIAQAAQAANVFCMEAMWTRFQPLLGVVRDKIQAGAIGDLRGFDARFMAANVPDPAVSLFDDARGGGALMHRGIYPLSLARFLMGPVTEVETLARIGATDVDEDSALILRHEAGAISTLRASLSANGDDDVHIYGTKGRIVLNGPVWRPTKAVLTSADPASGGTGGAPRRFESFRESSTGLRLSSIARRLKQATGRKQTRITAPFAGNGYRHQAMAVMRAIRNDETQDDLMPLSESIEIMQIVDDVRNRWANRGDA